MVEIAAVDVGYRFHSFPIKKIGPQTLRPKTLFRVGRTLRLDMNLLTGSAHIVPNRGGEDKGADFRNFEQMGTDPTKPLKNAALRVRRLRNRLYRLHTDT